MYLYLYRNGKRKKSGHKKSTLIFETSGVEQFEMSLLKLVEYPLVKKFSLFPNTKLIGITSLGC